MIENLFPTGISNYLIGGLLIGVGLSLIFIFTGIVAGISTFFTSTLSFFSRVSYFNQQKFKESRNWRLLFAFSLILGGFIFMLFFNNGTIFITEVSFIRLAIGGFLIGIGARLSSGCTSGHGICGMSKLSYHSFLAVIVFLSVAIITAILIKSLGVFP